MTLEEFAKMCGVSIIPCDAEDWGGPIAYAESDVPNCTMCGFKSEKAAYRHWLQDKFGPSTSKTILKLLRTSGKRR